MSILHDGDLRARNTKIGERFGNKRIHLLFERLRRERSAKRRRSQENVTEFHRSTSYDRFLRLIEECA